MTEYDEQDQAYQDLLEEAINWQHENKVLRDILTEICGLIYYQAHLKHQDAWLMQVIKKGLYTIEEE